MTQKNAFLESEGDRWYERNKTARSGAQTNDLASDPVLTALSAAGISFSNALEIGASNGWRLAALKNTHPESRYTGLEPSAKAVTDAFPDIDMKQGTADELPFKDGEFDLVIFGFCLYLCDRRDLFRIAAEADRVLRDNGALITYDFHTPVPYKNRYAHASGLHSYKMDYSRLFSWNPSYRIVSQTVTPHPGSSSMAPDHCVGVTILRKDIALGWPANPYAETA